jgi:hypothetical protein
MTQWFCLGDLENIQILKNAYAYQLDHFVFYEDWKI